jgi:hypothetical protein
MSRYLMSLYVWQIGSARADDTLKKDRSHPETGSSWFTLINLNFNILENKMKDLIKIKPQRIFLSLKPRSW